MSEPGTIYRYRQLTPFTTQGSGTAQWCVGEWEGRRYFIKEFLTPTLPPADADMSTPVNIARRDSCMAFFRAKKRLYRTLQSVNNGCLVCPDGDEDLFVHEGHYCAVSPFITPDVEPDAICRLSVREKLVLMRTLVLTLGAVHGAGIVHSDLKLENLMVTRNATGACNLKLIDFDSAFFRDAPPGSPEEMHGDLAYLAPETLAFMDGERVPLTEKLDVFALGLVMHRMACGAMPRFDPARFQCAGEAVADGAPLGFEPSLPGPLREIIARMLSADPAARPSLREVYERLGTLLFPQPQQPAETPPPARNEEQPLAPQSPSRPPVPAAPRKKDRGGVVIAAAAAMLLLGALVILWLIMRK